MYAAQVLSFESLGSLSLCFGKIPPYPSLPHSLQSEGDNLNMQQIQHVQCPILLWLLLQTDMTQMGVLFNNTIQSKRWQCGKFNQIWHAQLS